MSLYLIREMLMVVWMLLKKAESLEIKDKNILVRNL